MYTLAIILSFGSVWSLFSAANKVEFAKKNLTSALSKKTKLAKMVALLSFLGSTILFAYLLGTVVGILSSCVIWMILASAVVLFAPFPKLKFIHFVLLVVLVLGVDLLFTFIL